MIERRDEYSVVIRDMKRPHKTVCGYPIKDLEATISKNLDVTYQGFFKGYEGVWLQRKWHADGSDFYGTPQMDLIFADEEVENESSTNSTD